MTESVSYQELGVAVASVSLLFVALAMFRSTMRDLRLEMSSDVTRLETAINGLRYTLQKVADAAASKHDLAAIQRNVLDHDRQIIRMESSISAIRAEMTSRKELGDG